MPRAGGIRRGLLPTLWLGVAFLGLGASACCHPPGFVPRVPSECINWDYKQSRHEIRGLANDIADLLPNWESTGMNWQKPGSVRVDYAGLKAAAIKMARAPRCVHRPVIDSYIREYGGQYGGSVEYDEAKTSALFVLMRVLFVLPTHYTAHGWQFGWWHRPRGHDRDISWPVHEDPSGRVLEIDWYAGASEAGGGSHYDAVDEYDYFAERFPMRTVAEIQALEIRSRP